MKQYYEWIKTPSGYRWWIQKVSEHHIRFRCEQCGGGTKGGRGIIWQTKGKAIPETMRCGDPCYGVMRRMPVSEFWEKERSEG